MGQRGMAARKRGEILAKRELRLNTVRQGDQPRTARRIPAIHITPGECLRGRLRGDEAAGDEFPECVSGVRVGHGVAGSQPNTNITADITDTIWIKTKQSEFSHKARKGREV